MIQNKNILSERQKQQIAELQQKQQAEMVSALMGNNFDPTAIPAGFNMWLSKGLSHEKMGNLQCDWKTLRVLFIKSMDESLEYTLQEFGFSCNCIEDKTPAQLGVALVEYIEIQDSIQELAEIWKKRVAALHEPIQAKYKNLIDQVRSNKPIIMP